MSRVRNLGNPDEHWMRECLRLARKGEGSVSPNPIVGALLVSNGKVVARGHHRTFGGPHAEVECLLRFHGRGDAAVLYVNLEPCSHYGKTPPCSDAIIRSAVRRVVVGMVDPHPLVSGRGVKALRRAGIEVKVGVLEQECRDANRVFVTHVRTGRPHIHMKIAQTIDGKIAGRAQRWITSAPSRRLVHRWRSIVDAVLVGAGTIITDDSLLDVREVNGRNPGVVVLDGKLRIPVRSRVFSKEDRRVFVCTTLASYKTKLKIVKQMERKGATIIPFDITGYDIPIRKVCKRLYSEGIGSILVEGGARVFHAFAAHSLVDRLSIFAAPFLLPSGLPSCGGGGVVATRQQPVSTSVRPCGADLLMEYFYRASK